MLLIWTDRNNQKDYLCEFNSGRKSIYTGFHHKKIEFVISFTKLWVVVVKQLKKFYHSLCSELSDSKARKSVNEVSVINVSAL